MGTPQSPFDRYRVRAASLTIWSNAVWMKSANWISAMGIRPLSAAPIATPTIADSARGVSSTRASPKRAYRPSVAPDTPPFLPTSSPRTRTRSSRSISSEMAARTASIIRISGMEFSLSRLKTCDGTAWLRARLDGKGRRVNNLLEVRAISFSAEVKNEMAGLLPARPCCQLSELLGVYFGSRGRLLGNQRGRSAYFSLLRNAVARKVVRLGRAVGPLEAKYQAMKTRKRMSFFIELTLPPELVMEFENVRVLREVSGEVNRRLNFETANIGKTIGSGLRQAAAIERLMADGKLDRLPPALREMARWRVQNPELNLGELAGRMKLSKSAVNHRLRRLHERARPVAEKQERRSA